MSIHRERIAYGDHPDQYGELFLPEPGAGPAGGSGASSAGTIVLVHGGYWRDRYTAELGVPSALDLAALGHRVWNLEYRRAGTDGAPGAGGWPATFEDVAAGLDLLTRMAEVDATRVVLLGHSAGGHLAAWAAARSRLPAGAPGASPLLLPRGVVSQAGLLDLAEAHRLRLSDDAVANLMGGTAGDFPEPYRLADPARLLPLGIPVLAVHSRDDVDVPFALSETFVTAAAEAGDPAELHETSGDHFSVITPGTEAYELCRELAERLLR